MVSPLMPDPAATLTLEADIAIWGASLWGDSDPGVLAVEEWRGFKGTRFPNFWLKGALWDTMGRIDTIRILDKDGDHPAPWRYSLPWVTEHIWRADA